MPALLHQLTAARAAAAAYACTLLQRKYTSRDVYCQLRARNRQYTRGHPRGHASVIDVASIITAAVVLG